MVQKSKNFIINIPIYNRDVMVSLGETDEILIKKLIKCGIPKNDAELCKFKSPKNIGRAICFAGGESLIRLRIIPRSEHEFGILHHELFHVVHFIMNNIGMPLTDESVEAYTYLIQFLTTKIYANINDK